MAAGAVIRRVSLRSRFGISIPLRYSAGPVVAAALAALAVVLTARLAPEAFVPAFSFAAGLHHLPGRAQALACRDARFSGAGPFPIDGGSMKADHLSQPELRNVAQDAGNPSRMKARTSP